MLSQVDKMKLEPCHNWWEHVSTAVINFNMGASSMRQFVEGCRRQNLQAIKTGYPLVIQPIAISYSKSIVHVFSRKTSIYEGFPIAIYIIYIYIYYLIL